MQDSMAMDVVRRIAAAETHLDRLAATGVVSVPVGAILYFESAAQIAAAGPGWAEYVAAAGRIIIAAGTTDGQTFTSATDYGTSWTHGHAVGTLDVGGSIGNLDVGGSIGNLDVGGSIGTLDVGGSIGTLDVGGSMGTANFATNGGTTAGGAAAGISHTHDISGLTVTGVDVSQLTVTGVDVSLLTVIGVDVSQLTVTGADVSQLTVTGAPASTLLLPLMRALLAARYLP